MFNQSVLLEKTSLGVYLLHWYLWQPRSTVTLDFKRIPGKKPQSLK